MHSITADREQYLADMDAYIQEKAENICGYKVTGWSDDCDERYIKVSGTFCMDDNPPELDMSAIRKAIVREINSKGYKFTGDYHQNGEYGMPVINNKYIVCYSQRSWGGIMADALDLPNDDGYAYVKWAWLPPEGETYIVPYK